MPILVHSRHSEIKATNGNITYIIVIEVFVFSGKLTKASITLSKEKVVLDNSVNISCTSDGFPDPSYNITHNGTELTTNQVHTIQEANWTDGGIYQCVVCNETICVQSDRKTLKVVSEGEILRYILRGFYGQEKQEKITYNLCVRVSCK